MFLSVCVCVRERERERGCVCLCVNVREKKGAIDRDKVYACKSSASVREMCECVCV